MAGTASVTIKHGYSAYAGDRCRCDICRAAAQEYGRQYRARMTPEQRAAKAARARAYARMTPEEKERRRAEREARRARAERVKRTPAQHAARQAYAAETSRMMKKRAKASPTQLAEADAQELTVRCAHCGFAATGTLGELRTVFHEHPCAVAA